MRKKRTFNLHFLRIHMSVLRAYYIKGYLNFAAYVRSCYSYSAFCYCETSHFWIFSTNNELFIRSIKTFRIFNTLPVTLSTRFYDRFVTKVQLFCDNFSLWIVMLKTRSEKRSDYFFTETPNNWDTITILRKKLNGYRWFRIKLVCETVNVIMTLRHLFAQWSKSKCV